MHPSGGDGSHRTACALTQERRYVDVLVADLERGPLASPRDGRPPEAASRSRRGAPPRRGVEAGADHRHADLVLLLLVDHRAEDDVRLAVGGALDDLRRLVDLEEAEVASAGDVEQDPRGAVDRLLEQRRGDRRARRVGGPALAGADPDPHHRGAGVGHDRPHVGEVEVDQPRDRDQVGDALDALAQDVVGLAERVEDRRAPLDDREQALVGDHEQRVDDLAQLADPVLRLARRAGCPRSRTAA